MAKVEEQLVSVVVDGDSVTSFVAERADHTQHTVSVSSGATGVGEELIVGLDGDPVIVPAGVNSNLLTTLSAVFSADVPSWATVDVETGAVTVDPGTYLFLFYTELDVPFVPGDHRLSLNVGAPWLVLGGTRHNESDGVVEGVRGVDVENQSVVPGFFNRTEVDVTVQYAELYIRKIG